MTEKPETELNVKKVDGRIRVLKALPYRDCMIYLRMIDKDIFTYDLIYDNQLYSSYMIITPKKGKTKLSDDEINQCAALILSGATSTIDTLMGTKLEDRTNEVVKTFEAIREPFD